MDSKTRDDTAAEPQRPRGRRRLLFALTYAVFLFALVEGGARGLWCVRGAGFWSAPRDVYKSFYPAVAAALRTPPPDKPCFEILFLGGSVLHPDYGDVAHVLRERLIRETRACVHITNVSAPAHTTLDSLYKYRHLADRRFDLVVVYHGINDVRANNCDADTFREDYSHYSWYRLINDFERHAADRHVVFPYTIEFVAVKLAERLGMGRTLPTHRPDAAQAAYGCDVKTVASVRKNLTGILELARSRHEPVVLMTFAYYIPDGYSEDAFAQKTLDYTAHSFPIELWGKPECVARGIDAHNAIVRDLAQTFDDVTLIDQKALIPPDGVYFNDVCHLTHEGCARFADDLLEVIRPRM